MISYNFKLIIFSIILGTLTSIYNNHCDGLYKNINCKNTVLVPTKLRSLGELLYEPTTNHKHENNKLREYRNTNDTNYMKNQYPNDDAKKKQNVLEVTERENTRTINSNKYEKEKETQSNKSSRSIKYLEMQRKLYNNFYVKPEMYFEHLSDKSNYRNDKSCEWANNKSSSDKLSAPNKVHDNYLDNLKTGCVGGVGACAVSSVATGIAGNVAAVTAAHGILKSSYPLIISQIEKVLVGVSLLSKSAIGKATASITTFASTDSAVAATAATGAFFPYGMVIVALIAVAIIVILLYVWLHKRRKNSWKHECKKHLCT